MEFCDYQKKLLCMEIVFIYTHSLCVLSFQQPCTLNPLLLFALLRSRPGLLHTQLLWVRCVWTPKWWCWERRVWGRPAWWRDTFIIASWLARTRTWVSADYASISMLMMKGIIFIFSPGEVVVIRLKSVIILKHKSTAAGMFRYVSLSTYCIRQAFL